MNLKQRPSPLSGIHLGEDRGHKSEIRISVVRFLFDIRHSSMVLGLDSGCWMLDAGC